MRKLVNNTVLSSVLVVLTALFISCEKIDTEAENDKDTSAEIPSENIDKNKDTDNKDENTDSDDNSESPESEDEGSKDETGYVTGDIVSVNEFLRKDIKCQVWVVGRIVGACTRSKTYAQFKAPFTHSQAILIADSINENNIENVASVCLTTNKSMREDLNLTENPYNYNQTVAVFGFRENYLGLCGIKKPDGYKFPVNIK